MTLRRSVFPVLALWLGLAAAARADAWQPQEQWRIEEGSVAPWAQPGTKVDPAYRGRGVRFQLTRLAAPAPLACDGAEYEWVFVGAESLFEGNLPAPSVDAARRLGIDTELVATLRVVCANAGFDFHRNRRGELLLGLDNVVWTLRPTRGATTPAEVLQELLILHFTHDMSFTRDSASRKNAWLSSGLRGAVAAYFAAPQSPDAVPPINGDPFTDSQEYPDRFTLGAARMTAQRATVPVFFGDERARRRIDYVLVREGSRWVVDDLVDERGESLRTLLGK